MAQESIVSGSDSRVLKLLQEARKQLQSERERRTEPIAIVGIGCRFPGGVSDTASFWSLLRSGTDATTEVPRDRWDVEALYSPDPEVPGKLYVKRGGFLDGIQDFDASFFGISPREALGMDPQQRLLLEVTWEALEDAGIPPSELRGTATGVWVGFCLDDYGRRSVSSGDATRIDAYSALGNTRSIAAGRISYVLDLRGPAIQIDTACSSSLVAVHQACAALRSGECDFALVGGVNLMSSPEATIALCKMRALSKDGRCKTFDAAADGYGRGDGCGMLVLERLSDARAAGHRTVALIRGSATNQDGHSNGLTAPNGLAQEAVIRSALANAGLEARDVSYVEAHGTGTLLGDPIEVLALNRVYGASRESPIYVGAVKTNFGHLEGAAGVAGIIKAVLCIAHREIPPNVNLKELNPRIPWADLNVSVARTLQGWPQSANPRLAGVSSFGISGTNAHAIIEGPPSSEVQPFSAPARSAELVLLSAKSPEGLNAVALRLLRHLEAHPHFSLGDVAFSLVTTRSLFDHRLALSVSSRTALLDALALASSGQSPPGAQRSEASPSRGKTAWLFTGQGAQNLGMGQRLAAEWPVFRDALDHVCSLFDPLLGLPLRQVMWAEPLSPTAALLHQTGFTQPALFALEWALASLWRSFGVEPDVLLGHSIGEITAATVAGVFSLEDAVRLVAARARLMQALPAGGSMLSVSASESQVLDALRPFEGSVSLAALNGPASVVVSGAARDIDALVSTFAGRRIQTRRLTVSHAFHSPLMEPMLADFRKVAQSLAFRTPQLPLISNLTGALADQSLCSADYWVRQVRDAVRFAPGIQTLIRLGTDCFLELGPRPTLLGLVAACLPEHLSPALLSSLRPSVPEPETLLGALGAWIARGGHFDRGALFPASGRRLPLPTYPWQRQRFWLESPALTQHGEGHPTGHPLLGSRISRAGADAVYESFLSPSHPAWLAAHQLGSVVVLPATALAELLRAAADNHSPGAAHRVCELVLQALLVTPSSGRQRVQVVLTEGATRASVYSRPDSAASDAAWTLHASARYEPIPRTRPPSLDLDSLRARCSLPVAIPALYSALHARGLHYGFAFQALRELWRAPGDPEEAFGQIAVSVDNAHAFGLHPALAAAALQTLQALAPDDATTRVLVPFALGAFSVFEGGASSALVHARIVHSSPDSLTADVSIARPDGSLLAQFSSVSLRRTELGAFSRSAEHEASNASTQGRSPSVEAPAVAPALDEHSILAAVKTEVARALSLPGPESVSLHKPLAQLGLDSLMSVELRSGLNRNWKLQVPSTVSPDTSVTELVALLLANPEFAPPVVMASAPGSPHSEEGLNATSGSPRGAICERLNRPKLCQTRLFCFPDAGGYGSMFLPFTRLDEIGTEVHTISCPRDAGSTGPEAAARYLESASEYIGQFGDRPFILFGHSLGGLLAWRIAQQLAPATRRQLLLFAPSACPPVPLDSAVELASEALLMAIFADRIQDIEKLTSFRADWASDLALWNSMAKPASISNDFPIAAFVGREDATMTSAGMEAWNRFTTSDFSLTVVPGDHWYLAHREQSALVIDDLLARLLSGSSARNSSHRPRRSTTTVW